MPEAQPEQKLCRKEKEKLRKQAQYQKRKENPEFIAKEKERLKKRSQQQYKVNSDMHNIFIPALRECLGLDPRYDVWPKRKEKNDDSTTID